MYLIINDMGNYIQIIDECQGVFNKLWKIINKSYLAID